MRRRHKMGSGSRQTKIMNGLKSHPWSWELEQLRKCPERRRLARSSFSCDSSPMQLHNQGLSPNTEHKHQVGLLDLHQQIKVAGFRYTKEKK